MKLPKFVCLTILASVTMILAIVIVLLSASNARAQQTLQAQQMAINNGILGPQGQQISSAILQDMASAAVSNVNLRNLLGKYGYTIQPGNATEAPAGSTNKAATKEEVRNE